ncbi:MAG TPA: hypothetical protein VNK91_01960 [Burkholderiaceae bacterium]|nr:hypothetical protein [Burkholderiaceae bacterium]
MPPLNEYDDILARGQAPAGNEYDELLAEQRRGEISTLRQSFAAADPDRRAKALALAERTRLPAEVVERNLELVQQQDAIARNDYDALLDRMPRTAEWLMESPDNAAVAHDDLDNLGTFEALTTAMSTGYRHGRQTTELGRLGFALAGGNRDPTLIRRVETLERELAAAPGGRGFLAQWVYPAAKIVGQMLDSGTKALEGGFAGASAGAAAAAIAGQIGPQFFTPEEIVTVPVGAGAGFVAGLGAGFWGDVYQVEAGHSYLTLSGIRGAGGATIAESTKRAAATAVGLINATLESVGVYFVTAPFKAAAKKFVTEGTKQAIMKPTVAAAAANFAKAYGTAVAGEVTTEVLQESANIMVEELAKLATDGDFDTLLNSPEERDAAVERLFAIASETFRGMALVGLPGATVNLAADVRNVSRARENQQFFEALGDTATRSKLRERLPAKLQELLERVTHDGPVENVYIPVEQFATYFQTARLDPRAVAAELLGDPAAYDAALQTGEDLKIPTARYAATLAASDHHKALVPHLRLHPDEMTPAEADAFVESLKQEAAAPADVTGESARSVREDVLGQLLGLGFEPGTAEAYAELYESTFRTLGQRAGVDPHALYQRYGLKIERPTPEVLRQHGETDALDVMIERLRKGDLPTDRDIFGPSLVDFLVSRGGLREQGGELAARDARLARRGLVREQGLELDHAAELAVEAGYLAERDPNQLLEAIGAELAGEPVFARGRANTRLLDVRGAIEEIGTQLRALGIDVRQVTDNERIKRALRTGESIGGPVRELAQRVREFFQGRPATAPAETLDQFLYRREQARRSRTREAGLVVGLRTQEGEIIAGEPGQLHFQLLRAYPEEAQGAEFGYVDKNGRFYTRGEAHQAFLVTDASQLAAVRDTGLFQDIIPDRETSPIQAPDGTPYLGVSEGRGRTALRGYPISREEADRLADFNVVFRVAVKGPADTTGLEGWFLDARFTPDARTASYRPAAAGAKVALFDDDTRELIEAIHRRGEPTQFIIDTAQDVLIIANAEGESRVPLGGRPYYQRDTDIKRGAIRIGADRQISIRLLEKADLSTFLHETGHFYLEVLGDLVTQADAPADLVSDYQTILDWLGVKSREEITPEHHEQFARGFEAYLLEGSAPSAGLRSVFAKFRAWLVAIYRTIVRLNVTLTDDVRGVMDRLLATEEEIAAAEREAEITPIFATAADAGMSETEFAAYRHTVAQASVAARETLQRQLLAEQQRAHKQWYRKARAAIRAEVAAEVDAQPEQRAAALLALGTLPDGSPLPEGMRPFKLDRQAIVDVYGADFAKRLPRNMLTREGGVAPDPAAEALGYPTGEQLLLALVNLRKRDTLIEAETDARLRERYGDLLLDGTALTAAAQQAVNGPERAKVIAAELAALRRKAREVRPFVRAEQQQQAAKQREGLSTLRGTQLPVGQIRAMAEGMIAQKRVRELNPNTYLVAVRRAAKQAVEAAAQGAYDVAAAAKQRELLNLELYRAAVAAHEEVEAIADDMQRFGKTKTRERIGRAGADYLAQIDALLDRFEFKRVSTRELANRQALAEWIARKEAAGETLGEELAIPPPLIDEARRTNYRNLTVEELRGLRDAVKQIEHFARLKNKLLAAKVAREREEARAELLTAIEANLADRGPPPISKNALSATQRLGARAAAFDASLLKMEQLVDWLDGGKLDGPWHRYLWDGAADAQAAELDYTQRITRRLAQAVLNIPREITKRMRERVAIPGVERTMTRKDLLGVALNVGNDSNYQKLLKGMGWTESQVEQMLARLTKAEWDFVQSVWDTLESLWPDIARLQKDLTGLEPEKIAPRPVPTRFGQYRGGYYPVIYDPLASEQGELQLAARIGNLVEGTYTRATTPKGHTKARVEEFARPFDLDIDNLPGHIAGVVKDLTHRKWLLDANWIVHDRELRAALRRHLGDEYVGLFGDWVRHVVNDRNFASLRSLGIWRRTIEQLRYNVMIAAMGFKAATMMTQIAGAGPAIEVIGGKEGDGRKYFLRGLGQFLRRPRATYDYVTGLSGEMRHRVQTRDRDLRDKLRLLQGREDFLAKVQEFAMRGIVYAEMIVSLPAWLGAYQKAIEAGATPETAIRAGDRAVRLSQGAAGAKDLAAVMAKNDLFMRTITMFYTPFNALYNRLRDVGHSVHGIRDVPQAAFRLWWVWLMPAVLAELLAGRGPGDDDEGEWWLRTILLYPTLAVPFLRDLAVGTFGEFGYQLSPLAQVGEAVTRTVQKAGKVAAGDADLEELVKPALRTTGYLLGLPTGQVEITGGYLYDLALGDDPEDLGAFAHDLLYRRRAE